MEANLVEASELAQEARRKAASNRFDEATTLIDQAAARFREGEEFHERLLTERNMMQILGSVGLQMTAFVHEIDGLLGMVHALEEAVEYMRKRKDLDPKMRKLLGRLCGSIGDLRRVVERHASYLTDITSPDARRRRSRQNLSERFEAGARLVRPAAERRKIEVKNEIPPDLKSPPMFPAEITLVFSNLITNAIKAAGQKGIIRASGRKDVEGKIILRVENTGRTVNLEDTERWFRPFESTTVEVDTVLGQGMGMGLPITRNMLEEYGAEIHFCAPSSGFAAALEIIFNRD